MKFRAAVDPRALIKSVFPQDASVIKELGSDDDGIVYATTIPTDSELFAEFNKFLDALLGGAFEDEKQFQQWLYGDRGIEFSWSKAIDDEAAQNSDNVAVLWRSLLFDYAKRLTFHGTALRAHRKQGLFTTSFDKLTSPSGRAQAPYFLTWFFDTLQNELSQADQELTNVKEEWAVRRMAIPIALSTAAGAFGYFIIVMFMFLLVSIESSVRTLASKEQKLLPSPASGDIK